jgi:isoleucyl-tRNA synthetase
MVSLRQDVSKALEEARASKLIGSSLEARIEIRANEVMVESLRQLEDAEGFFIVSQLALTSIPDDQPVEVLVSKAEGLKCPRCWIWSTGIGESQRFPDVCPRCASVLEQTS